MAMTSRERVLAQLTGGVPDRIARTDSPWAETVRRWRQEGLGEEEDVGRRFGFDLAGVGGCDTSLRLPGETIEDCDEYCIQRDANGVLRKDFKRDSGHTPHWLDHTIKTPEDWFWLIGYLVGKAIRPDDPGKRLHHIITTAAACLNWHRHEAP